MPLHKRVSSVGEIKTSLILSTKQIVSESIKIILNYEVKIKLNEPKVHYPKQKNLHSIKKINDVLASVARLLEHHTMHQKVAGSISGQVHTHIIGLIPGLGVCMGQLINASL